MRNQALVQKLAQHFTGLSAIHQSMSLGMPGVASAMAKEFFEVRELLGIRGYDSAEEAAIVIERVLYGDER